MGIPSTSDNYIIWRRRGDIMAGLSKQNVKEIAVGLARIGGEKIEKHLGGAFPVIKDIGAGIRSLSDQNDLKGGEVPMPDVDDMESPNKPKSKKGFTKGVGGE